MNNVPLFFRRVIFSFCVPCFYNSGKNFLPLSRLEEGVADFCTYTQHYCVKIMILMQKGVSVSTHTAGCVRQTAGQIQVTKVW